MSSNFRHIPWTCEIFTKDTISCYIPLNCVCCYFLIHENKHGTVGNVQALGANGKAAFSPKAHG